MTKSKKVHNWMNYEPRPGKLFEMASITVPDQTLTIQEMLKRHSNGIGLTGNNNPMFDEESSGLDMRKLDLVDLQRLKMENEARVHQLKEKAANEALEAKKRKKEQKAEEARQLLAELNKENEQNKP